jgi:hypothetical protein
MPPVQARELVQALTDALGRTRRSSARSRARTDEPRDLWTV